MSLVNLLTSLFYNDTATTEIYTLSLHDALPIYPRRTGGVVDAFVPEWPERPGRRVYDVVRASGGRGVGPLRVARAQREQRSEEHTSELQSQSNLVCRLLLEKKKKQKYNIFHITH